MEQYWKKEGNNFVKVNHPIFIDTDVGFEPSDSECLIEHDQDDDVDTDDEVKQTALQACSRDFNNARTLLDRTPVNHLINNFEI